MKHLTITLLTLLVLGGCSDSEPKPKIIILDSLPEIKEESIQKRPKSIQNSVQEPRHIVKHVPNEFQNSEFIEEFHVSDFWKRTGMKS